MVQIYFYKILAYRNPAHLRNKLRDVRGYGNTVFQTVGLLEVILQADMGAETQIEGETSAFDISILCFEVCYVDAKQTC